ncbi:MAG: CapA family protein [Flavobacteriales bacterium]|nr:CapA family protein [Flavobacteriales bacterium]MBT4738489.1 CapA family protein [Flavobacteriales bacterium]
MNENLFLSCRIPLLLLLFISCFNISCQATNNKKESSIIIQIIDSTLLVETDEEISFLFMGDFMQHSPQIKAAKDSVGNYDYGHYFDYTNSLIQNVDFAIANLEVTLAGKPYDGYPRFSSPDEYAVAIQNAGFDVLTTANNHSNDCGSDGLVRTINVLDSLKFMHLGTYKDSIERINNYPLIIEKKGIKVALLNYTYGTNGLDTKHPNIVNMIDEEIILQDIQIARDSNIDKIIVITHWGGEYRSFPDEYQKKWGEWLLSNGADIVIGGHPHWVQPAEYRKDSLNNERIIIWSLGNIISNQRVSTMNNMEHTDGGSSLQFSLYRDSTGEVKFKNIGYHLHWVWLHNKDDRKRYQILPISKSEKILLNMEEKSKKELNKFIDNERSLYLQNNINVPEFQYNLKSDSYYLE